MRERPFPHWPQDRPLSMGSTSCVSASLDLSFWSFRPPERTVLTVRGPRALSAMVSVTQCRLFHDPHPRCQPCLRTLAPSIWICLYRVNISPSSAGVHTVWLWLSPEPCVRSFHTLKSLVSRMTPHVKVPTWPGCTCSAGQGRTRDPIRPGCARGDVEPGHLSRWPE